MKKYPLVLLVSDIQEIMHISRVNAYKLASRPDFPAKRIGKSIRIPRDAFFNWLNRNPEPDGKLRLVSKNSVN